MTFDEALDLLVKVDEPVRELIIDLSNAMVKTQDRVIEMEVHMQSMEERLRDYLETALVREDAANQRADKAERRRLPHWTDMSR